MPDPSKDYKETDSTGKVAGVNPVDIRKLIMDYMTFAGKDIKTSVIGYKEQASAEIKKLLRPFTKKRLGHVQSINIGVGKTPKARR